MPSLEVPYRIFLTDVVRLRAIVSSLEPLIPDHRYPIAELVCLRLFDSFEFVVASTAYRLACGAKYLNATSPLLRKKARTIDDARYQMLTHNRVRIKSFLEWSKASYIAQSVEHVIDERDHFTTFIRSNGTYINKLRIVRNVIAHQNRVTKQEYRDNVLRPRYGSNRFLRPGVFLLSQRFGGITPVMNFIESMEILVSGIVQK